MERNKKLDAIKGLAILLVITSHIFLFKIPDASSTFLFKLIWVIQIPLFIIVSGFLFNSKKITNISSLVNVMIIKTKYLLIPFFSYFVLRILMKNGPNINIGENFIFLLYHIDQSLWYLFVLWIFYIVFSLSHFIVNKIIKNNIENNSIIKHIIMVISIILLLSPFLFFVINGNSIFLGAKYILYYCIFFYIGYIINIEREKFNVINAKYCNILFSIGSLFFLYLVYSFDFYGSSD